MKTLIKKYTMKTTTYTLVLSVLFACNPTTKKASDSSSTTEVIQKKELTFNTSDSGDYSTLLNNYECDMTSVEIAEVLKVKEGDIKLDLQDFNTKCYAQLSGYGDTATTLSWGTVPSSKKGNKKAIAEYLKDKKNGEAVMGMDIELAETGDCYLTYQPLHGRMLIYNENYEQAFLLSYGLRGKRTKEQHEELKEKMTDLANYLLKKHQK